MSTQFRGKLPRFQADAIGGTDPALERFAQSINEMLARIPRSIVGVPPIDVSIDNDRWLISLGDQSTKVPLNLTNFVVIKEYDDFVKCAPFDYNFGEAQLHDPKLGTKDSPTSYQAAAIEGGDDDLYVQKIQKYMKMNNKGIYRDTGEIVGEGGDIPYVPPPDQEDPPPPDLPPPEFRPGYIYVAKPRLLQRTPFNNKTVTLRGIDISYSYDNSEKGKRTASAAGESASLITELQVITPPYFPGDIITARGHLTTGVFTTDIELITDADNGKLIVLWEDINSGGRQWAVTAPPPEGQGT